MPKRKKILEVIFAFDIGGSERLGCAIAEAMTKKGYEVKVIALYTSDGPIKDQLRKSNIEAIGMDLERNNMLTAFWKLYKLFLNEHPDVIHAHHVTQFVKTYWPAKLAGVKRIVLTEHANYSLIVKPRLRLLAKIFTRHADIITTVYKKLEIFFIENFHIKPENILTIPNGVDIDKYLPKPFADIHNNTFAMACIGRLVEAKDHENLIKAIRILVNKGVTKIRVDIIGDGPLRDSISELIRQNGLSEYMFILGNKPDIEKLLHTYDILVLSSKREGFPMVILEAMSCGVPCVATSVGGVADIINQDNGWLVEKEDEFALADGILKAYKNKDRLQDMGKAARATIVANYDIRNILNMYETVF